MVRRSPSPEERQRDAERTKALILEAGTKEFASKGFAGARVSQIADRAGVNKQLISYYFGGKEGLYRAIGDRWRKNESDAVLAEDDLFETLRHYVEQAVRDTQAPKLLAWEGLSYRESEQHDANAKKDEGVHSGLLAVFRKIQQSGALDERMDPTCLTLMMIAVAGAPAIYPHMVRGLCDAEASSAEFRAHFMRQLMLVVDMLMSKVAD